MQSLADGLPGVLHEFYVYVNESTWLQPAGEGGIDYSSLNEALPYWFNALVPLGHQLGNQKIKDQVTQVANRVLDLQTQDGWIGPEVLAKRNFWARAPLFLGLTQLVEADPGAWEDKVVAALRKFMDLANEMLHNNSQGHAHCAQDVDCSWGQARVQDMVITIHWLLERYPDNEQNSKLWDNMNLFYDTNPVHWDNYYKEGVYQPVITNAPGQFVHGVNGGQGLKASAVFQRYTNSEALRQNAFDGVDWTYRDHVSPSGTIMADEAERDLAPYMGSELCTAVELGYSMAYMYQTLGRNDLADKAERVIYNAMPVMMTGDKWGHQYMAQVNQPWAKNVTQDFYPGEKVFTNANVGMALTYGMEPQYPCCTVNHPQGYPKFVANSWVKAGDSGLGHALLGPSSVETEVAGGKVSVKVDTEYPFVNELTYTVDAEKDFDLYLRVPSWHVSANSSVTINDGDAAELSPDETTGMHKVSLPAGTSTVKYTIGASIRTEERTQGTIAVYYGALLYALELQTTSTTSFPHAYYDPKGEGLNYLPYDQLKDVYLDSTSPWNVAIDPSTMAFQVVEGGSVTGLVFSEDSNTNTITVDGCEVNWELHLDQIPDWAPKDKTCQGERRQFRMIPYGSAKLHMSQLPTTTF